MDDAGEIGWVAPRIGPRGGRSGPPESRPQLKPVRAEGRPSALGASVTRRGLS
jgi:hypothetical protein